MIWKIEKYLPWAIVFGMALVWACSSPTPKTCADYDLNGDGGVALNDVIEARQRGLDDVQDFLDHVGCRT